MSVTSDSSPDQGPYTKRLAEIFRVALKLLKEAGGQMPLRDILEKIPQRIQLTQNDLEVYKTGGVRWSVSLQFYAINYEKSGFITRDQGVWSLTPEGEKALVQPPEALFAQGRKAYAAWRKNAVGQGSNADEGQAEKSDSASEQGPALSALASADALATQARSSIAQAVLALNAYEFQAFVATVLRDLGYHIARLAPPGPDGGTDILAFPDPLGAQKPHVRVQVKHWKGNKASRDDVAALRGILIPEREIGLFVASGGISSDSLREATRGSPHIRCMDLDQLIDSYVENYERLDALDRTRIPLKRLFIFAPDEV